MTDPTDRLIARSVRPIDEFHDEMMAKAEADHQKRLAAQPPADRAALRETVVAALEHDSVRCPLCPGTLILHTPSGARAHFAGAHADAVLPPPADRAAVLHETADAVAQMRIGAEDPTPDDHVRGYNNALEHVEAELRRRADETPAAVMPSIPDQTDTAPADESPHIYMTAIRQQAAHVHDFTKAGKMAEALEHVGAIERLLAVYRRAVATGAPQDGVRP